MKKTSILLFLSLFSFAFLFSSCDDDEPGVSEDGVLRLDGDNLSSPRFFGGETHEAAVRFSSALTAAYNGRTLEAVRVFVNEAPSSMRVIVYGAGTFNTPGAVRYTQEVSNLNQATGRFWEIPLETPVSIDGSDLWVGIEVTTPTDAFIIGCDPGPAVNGGDWYSNNRAAWTTFRDFTGQAVDINWNIRGLVSEE